MVDKKGATAKTNAVVERWQEGMKAATQSLYRTSKCLKFVFVCVHVSTVCQCVCLCVCAIFDDRSSVCVVTC